ncbi:aspartate aminotransferase family protein [Desulfoplanes formicivorans]|uniref:Acetylornithine aminotransferase n=1 Tax=Desulfoplanes formicivorans TaxID=1592317 RepID=A0A194AMV0_9BACT|nr:aspartate aminotransferase family protein [Desulfoplanes formicivorans]GAU09939.1 acetylornithine aminotransferase [Desulfoplanes formicivorans]
MEYEELRKREARVMCQTYGRYPLAVKSAKGTTLIDFDGNKYLDLLAGIAVCNLGHSHPAIVDVMRTQAEKLVHVSNLFYQEEQIALAEKLLPLTGMDRVFFCNSGAEANEGAIKMARRYMQEVRGREAYEIITLERSFHGRTLATLTATGQDKIKRGFGPLPPGFTTVPFEDLAALNKAITPRTAAVMVEVIQGEGGIRPLSHAYLQQVRELCDSKDILLIVDEIQSGMGRTGHFWAHQASGITPDIFTAAKALANGLPMGAVFCSQEVAQAFGPGSHGTTFGGGAFVSAVATRVLEVMEQEGLVERSRELGAWMLGECLALKEALPHKIVDVRGRGLMIGIELAFPGQAVWNQLLQAGFVLNLTQERVLRLLPPLVVTREALQRFVDGLQAVLGASHGGA